MGRRDYDVRSEHAVEEVLSAMQSGEDTFLKANVKTLRLQNFFHHGIKCEQCGIKGTVFRIERVRCAGHHEYAKWHLNLYATSSAGSEVMMTADHIIPKSRGGLTVLENLQPMCARCNSRKGSLLPEEIAQHTVEHKKPRKKPKRRKGELNWSRILSFDWMFRGVKFALRNMALPAPPRKSVRI